ncbi:hypothetical protein BaRGS_00017113 [Batillaria attramentaria]|uniref:Uncharacterized protein n=1 Tax=Batillaria attramentaria TaxID=370345 RepID=A0ABD0KWW4_9CAEN
MNNFSIRPLPAKFLHYLRMTKQDLVWELQISEQHYPHLMNKSSVTIIVQKQHVEFLSQVLLADAHFKFSCCMETDESDHVVDTGKESDRGCWVLPEHLVRVLWYYTDDRTTWDICASYGTPTVVSGKIV